MLLHHFKLVTKLTLCIFLLQLISCNTKSPVEKEAESFVPEREALMKFWTKDTATFFWDVPPWDPDTIKLYELYYRTVESDVWQLLKNDILPSKQPQVTIHRNQIPDTNSILYFGVRYVTSSGFHSNIHTSHDSTAYPIGGWFMCWEK